VGGGWHAFCFPVGAAPDRGPADERRGGGEMATMTDPVCGTQIDACQAVAQSQYQGHTYLFCSVECKQKFDGDPKRFAKAA
jgi:YHS domain-containing protein